MPDNAPSHLFTPSPYFLVRVAGLSVQDVAGLHAPRSAATLDRLLDLEERLRTDAAEVTVALGAAVAATGDPAARRRLLALRRDVHNLRPLAENAADVAPAGAGDLLHAWLSVYRAYRDGLEEAATTVREELRGARLRLRELGRDSRLRQGIQLGAPLLDSELPRYLDAPGSGPLPKRLRGVERSLVNYAFRSAFKTSPFSSFTGVCLGRVAEDGPLLDLNSDAGAFRNNVRVNFAALGPVVDALALSEDVRRVLPVRLTSGRRHEDDRIRYVRRQYGYNPDPTAPTAGLLEEVDFSVPRGQVVDEIVGLLGDGPDLRVEELVTRLHERDPDGRPRDRLHAYVGKLLDLGLLVSPYLRMDPRAADPAADFGRRLAELPSAPAVAAAGRVGRMAACAERYASAGPARRAELAAEAGAQVIEAQRELGRPEADGPRTVFYEDSVSERVATVHRGQWESALLPQLERLAAVLPAFDPLVVDRVLAKEYFLERQGHGGRCADIAGFAHEFQRRSSGRLTAYDRREAGDTGDRAAGSPVGAELAALRRARDVLAEELGARGRDLPEGAAELCLDDELLERVRAPLAEVTPEVLPAAFFLQLARRDRDPVAALNFAYTGLGMPIGRFGYPLEHATGLPVAATLRDHAGRTRPDSAVYAELTGGYDASNLGWHAPLTPYEIVGPAEICFRPPQERLPVDDLVLAHDPDSGELTLRSVRLGVRVIPVYLGSLMPVALPEIQRTLLALSCTVMPNLNFGEWVAGRRIDGVEEHPRIRYRDLVLRRRQWSVTPESLPRVEHARESAGWLLGWRRWWRDRRLPAHLFCTVPGRAGGTRPRVAGKPRYVSPDSAMSMLAFEHDARSATGPIRLTEMVPGPDEAWPGRNGEGHTSELCIEITGVRKGRP
ncbi:hypothetical protein CFN78_12585 [Amycolatopsis antarctica]|uniref:Lantibiotic dehydratase N-terminal domain-containing protein n=1 Tax=Amycolatopsis antarctica TaxID=1854586 RepID=A0A263D3W2_9PSEU|nr:lantibiotic dehydratase [Amycolatopsis antarctica]OZM73051.1 hypothetical protein CFN78_12585 [Amycolatopsis antarctica]